MIEFNSSVEAGPRWFHINNRPLTLGGDHTWNNLVTMGGQLAPLGSGNFERFWTYEASKVNTDFGARWDTNKILNVGPIPWAQKEGKFNLEEVNKNYLRRLERRVKEALNKGKVVAVNFFEGSLVSRSWEWHAFNPKNNIQKVGPSSVSLVHTKGDWNKYQLSYIKKVINTLEKYNNVIYEVGNEPQGRYASVDWSKMIIDNVNKWTAKPIGASHVSHTSYTWMLDSGADWISPAISPETRPNFKGPVVFDTDHNWPLRSNVLGLKTAIKNNMIPLIMDSYNNYVLVGYNQSGDKDVITGLIR